MNVIQLTNLLNEVPAPGRGTKEVWVCVDGIHAPIDDIHYEDDGKVCLMIKAPDVP